MNDTIKRPTNSGWKPHEGKAYVFRDLPRRTVGDLQLEAYPGLSRNEVKTLNSQVSRNRGNNIDPTIIEESQMPLNKWQEAFQVPNGDSRVEFREYAPTKNNFFKRLGNVITYAKNTSKGALDLFPLIDPTAYGRNAFYFASPFVSRVVTGTPESYNKSYGNARVEKNYANGEVGLTDALARGRFSKSGLKQLLNMEGKSPEALKVLYSNTKDPYATFTYVLNHEIGHALDRELKNVDYLNYNKDKELDSISSLMASAKGIKGKPYYSDRLELLNGIGSATRALRSYYKADTGKVPYPGGTIDADNFRQFFNRNPKQMETFLENRDKSRIEPGLRLWSTLRMLNDEKKKQEIINSIIQNILPYTAQNNNQRFRNNPRVWS